MIDKVLKSLTSVFFDVLKTKLCLIMDSLSFSNIDSFVVLSHYGVLLKKELWIFGLRNNNKQVSEVIWAKFLNKVVLCDNFAIVDIICEVTHS